MNVTKYLTRASRSNTGTSDLDDALEFIVGSSGNKKGNKNQQTANKVKSLAQRRLAKTNTKGMKSMFSFFKKK